MSISHWLVHKNILICIVDMIWLLSNSIQSLLIPLLLSSLHWPKFWMDLMIIMNRPILQFKINQEIKRLLKLEVPLQVETYLQNQTSLIVNLWLLVVLWRDWFTRSQLIFQDSKERAKISVHKSPTLWFCSRKDYPLELCIILLLA